MTLAPLTTEQLDKIEERANNVNKDYPAQIIYLTFKTYDILSMVAELKKLRESEAALGQDFNNLTSRVMSLSKQLGEAKNVLEHINEQCPDRHYDKETCPFHSEDSDDLINHYEKLSQDYLNKWYPENAND